jgi:hypothetical protein
MQGSGSTILSASAHCPGNCLVADDHEWKACLKEAASHMKAHQLRNLFVYILFHNNPSTPIELRNLLLAEEDSLKMALTDDYTNQRSAQASQKLPCDKPTSAMLCMQQKMHCIHTRCTCASYAGQGTMRVCTYRHNHNFSKKFLQVQNLHKKGHNDFLIRGFELPPYARQHLFTQSEENW